MKDSLGLYLDQTRQYSRLNATEERAALAQLVELRRARWGALLSLPALRSWVLDMAPAFAPVEGDEQTLVAVLEHVDEDGTAAERVMEALEALAQEQKVSSSDFATYQQRVRTAGQRYLRARNRFVCSNLRLVLTVAKHYSDRAMSLADRMQEGNLGLIKAVERFDLAHGTRFSTYAVWWVRHSITRALIDRGRTVRIPSHLHTIFTKIRKVLPGLESRLGRPPTPDELSRLVGVEPYRVTMALEAMALHVVPLDTPEGDNEPPVAERLGISPPQEEIDAHIDDFRGEVLACRALEELAERERDILTRRFALDGGPRMTLASLGRRYGLSRERTRQIQNRALAALREVVDASPCSGLMLAGRAAHS